MADYEISGNFSENMEKLAPTDKAHADLFNHKFQTLLNNDNALKNQVEGIKQTHQNDTKNVENSISTLQKEKADKTEIPTSLPANGGDAETIGNLHATDFVQNKYNNMTEEDLKNPNYPTAYFAELSDGTKIGLQKNWYHILYFAHINQDGFGAQIAVPLHYDKKIYFRNSEGRNWSQWNEIITSLTISNQSVANADTLNNLNVQQIVQQGGKHLAGQGVGGGYSFLGDGAEDTGLFSDSDGDLYLMRNGIKIELPTNGRIPNTDTYPIIQAYFNKDYKNQFRTQLKGNTELGHFLTNARTIDKNVEGAPQYGACFAFGTDDVHAFISTSFQAPEAYIAGGNVNKLNWIKQLAFVDSKINPSNITGGQLGGYMNAPRDNNYGNARLRNISAGMTDLVAGNSPLQNGDIYICFE